MAEKSGGEENEGLNVFPPFHATYDVYKRENTDEAKQKLDDIFENFLKALRDEKIVIPREKSDKTEISKEKSGDIEKFRIDNWKSPVKDEKEEVVKYEFNYVRLKNIQDDKAEKKEPQYVFKFKVNHFYKKKFFVAKCILDEDKMKLRFENADEIIYLASRVTAKRKWVNLETQTGNDIVVRATSPLYFDNINEFDPLKNVACLMDQIILVANHVLEIYVGEWQGTKPVEDIYGQIDRTLENMKKHFKNYVQFAKIEESA